MTALDRALSAPKNLTQTELAAFLASEDEGLWCETFAAAREVKTRCGKAEVLPRGLIECSNVCAKDCLYCGIRKSNAKVPRYRLPEAEAFACIDEARRRGYPAVAFQAGEIESEANAAYYERLVAYAAGRTRRQECRRPVLGEPGNLPVLGELSALEVTLSLGEQTEEVYRRWKAAGAMRYLIRIETSNRELYAKLHPADCSFDRRLGCIRTLKRLGYVTGTGVMIGLPGQTLDDLANDIVFYGEENVDMVGMGPYIPHEATPLGAEGISDLGCQGSGSECLGSGSGGRILGMRPERADVRLKLALRMIALTRLYLHGVNIVAATALEALDPEGGRNRGIEAGANVVMPVLTPVEHRSSYDLYPGKVRGEGEQWFLQS